MLSFGLDVFCLSLQKTTCDTPKDHRVQVEAHYVRRKAHAAMLVKKTGPREVILAPGKGQGGSQKLCRECEHVCKISRNRTGTETRCPQMKHLLEEIG